MTHQELLNPSILLLPCPRCILNWRRHHVSDKPITAHVKLDLADYGLAEKTFQATHLIAKSPSDITETVTNVPRQIDQKLTIPSRTAWAWEVK
ncbi:MAG: hypothetical protein JXM70_17075 [Pirellulales bacterium]|nr:hypothetical protein [Pirellulales bacterium]